MVEAGEARLGGCDISLGIPDWQCKRCGHEWFDPTDPSRMQFDAALNEMFEQRLRDKAAREEASRSPQQSSGAPEGGGG